MRPYFHSKIRASPLNALSSGSLACRRIVAFTAARAATPALPARIVFQKLPSLLITLNCRGGLECPPYQMPRTNRGRALRSALQQRLDKREVKLFLMHSRVARDVDS